MVTPGPKGPLLHQVDAFTDRDRGRIISAMRALVGCFNLGILGAKASGADRDGQGGILALFGR